jgi:hypothetical protein
LRYFGDSFIRAILPWRAIFRRKSFDTSRFHPLATLTAWMGTGSSRGASFEAINRLGRAPWPGASHHWQKISTQIDRPMRFHSILRCVSGHIKEELA